MRRLMFVAVVGVLSMGGAAQGESVALTKIVDSCVAETLQYQQDGLSEKDARTLQARVQQECRIIVQRECSSDVRPLCQHYSGTALAGAEPEYSRSPIRAAFRP